MLYRYPKMQEKTAYETIDGNKRYDNFTGEELPPVPYIYSGQGSTAKPTAAAAQRTAETAVNTARTAAAAQAERQRKIDNLNTLKNREKSYLGNNYNARRLQAQSDNDDAMRSLYIAYMQGIRNIPQQTALWGAGGEIESLKTQHRLNYENNRAKQAMEYNGILNDIQQRYNSDLWELEQNYLKQLLNL